MKYLGLATTLSTALGLYARLSLAHSTIRSVSADDAQEVLVERHSVLSDQVSCFDFYNASQKEYEGAHGPDDVMCLRVLLLEEC